MYIVAGNANGIAESFHGSCIAGALGFAINKSAPCCVGIVVLPAFPCISTVAAKVVESCQGLLVAAHSSCDIIVFEALDHSSYL